MATFTASEGYAQPKMNVTGVQAVTGRITEVSATGTASSVFYFCKVPLGATIVDFMWYGSDAATNQTYKLGLRLPISDTWTVTESILSGDLSFTGGQNHTGSNLKLPVKVTLTNNATNTYAWVQAVALLAISATANHVFTLFYTMDSP